MASRGGHMVTGTNGADYEHREKIAAQYQISVLNKSRLRFCIFSNFVLGLVMLAKLSADILDRLDIFILEIEELQIPQPLWWEWAWLAGGGAGVAALAAMRRNNARLLRRYTWAVALLSLAPLLYCLLYYAPDVLAYLTHDPAEADAAPLDIQLWQGYPYGVLWYAFVLLAAQVHLFALYFSRNLLHAWHLAAARKHH